MLKVLSDYATCERHSQKVYWDLADAISAIHLDFSKPFLPESLAYVEQLGFLSADEKLRLNQIHANAYAHLFVFVEEFIIAEVHALCKVHLHGDRSSLRALLRFCEEEVKHQKLFEAFKEAFRIRFPVQCGLLQGKESVARSVTGYSPLSVMLLISMLEWVTQKHYLSCFREGGRDIDESFAELFRLHWVEEAQHAKLDSLEIDRIAQELSTEERDTAVSDFIQLCAVLDGLLGEQTRLIQQSFEMAISRGLADDELLQVYEAQLAGLRWTFLGCGMNHPAFLSIIEDIAPTRVEEVLALSDHYR